MNKDIYRLIDELVEYGIQTKLIVAQDEFYIRNQLLDLFKLQAYKEAAANEASKERRKLEAILEDMLDYAFSTNVIDSNDITTRDLFDTKIMGILVDRPGVISHKFEKRYREGAKVATDWFYDFSQNTNYIRRERIARDLRWKVDSQYGKIDITINRSKPEKDPRAIAAAKYSPQDKYPKCQLCMENEGYAGRLDHPARENHRIIPIKINDTEWGFQYSPYVYYNEHCIVFNSKHVPMKIEEDTFRKMFSFVEQFPHYFVGSNADLPIVGGSILSHDHFQGGRYTFAMEEADFEETFAIEKYPDVTAGIVKWPMSVIRIRHKDAEILIRLATEILDKWRGYSDESVTILAETDGEPHNTITPIARRRGDEYELDLVLRNNLTTKERPLGLYHPRDAYHHIKKENIGLIEVMGLAVLPARLDREMGILAKYLVSGNIKKLGREDKAAIENHLPWAMEIIKNYPECWNVQDGAFTCKCGEDRVRAILEDEIGRVFVGVLEDAGVFKCDKLGRKAFRAFCKTFA